MQQNSFNILRLTEQVSCLNISVNDECPNQPMMCEEKCYEDAHCESKDKCCGGCCLRGQLQVLAPTITWMSLATNWGRLAPNETNLQLFSDSVMCFFSLLCTIKLILAVFLFPCLFLFL